MYQVVNLEKPVSGYPISHLLGDSRIVPDTFEDNTFDGLKAYPSTFVGDTTVDQSLPGAAALSSVWAPVVLWHDLREVYTVRN
jgi:hypothetical protein